MKTKKIIILSILFLLVHIIISFLYIPFSSVFNFNEGLENKEIFFKGFRTFYLALLFPYIFSLVRLIKRNNVA
jgi:hypothetical protein